MPPHLPPLQLSLAPVRAWDHYATRQGTRVSARSYDRLVAQDADAYDAATGKLLFRFRKGVFDADALAVAREAFEDAARRASSYRRNAAGRRPDDRDGAHTLIAGYWDRRDIPGTQAYLKALRAAGQARPPALPNVLCRETHFTRTDGDRWALGQRFVRAIAAAHRRYAPAAYARQKARAAQALPDFVIPNTPYSTVTVNYNWATRIHVDAGDYGEGLGNLSVAGNAHWTGGYLVFPRYRVAVDVRPGDFMLMDVHEWHANTPLRPVAGAPERPVRLSFVAYLRERLPECRVRVGDMAHP